MAADPIDLETARVLKQVSDRMGQGRHPELSERLRKFNRPAAEPAYVTGFEKREDAWANAQTGIGTPRDKVTATGYTLEGQLPFGLIEELYHNDDVSARICDLAPEQALREGFELEDQDICRDLEALDCCDVFENAWVFARAYGGCAVLCGRPGAAETPAVGAGVTSLLVIDRYSLWVDSYYTNTADPKYAQPEYYKITRPNLIGLSGVSGDVQEGQRVHESRIITFPGARTSPRRKIANQYWDDSVLQRVYQVLQAYGLTWASIVHLLQDAAQGVYSMKELWNMIVSGNKQAVMDRMAVVDEQRSSARMILVDADNEKFERVPTPFTAIPELIDRISERLASAAGMPLTVLMGSSPAGMNATGQSDLELWYGKVRAQQRKVLTPRLQQLCAMIHPPMSKKPPKISYPALWSPTAKETAETKYITAQSDQVYRLMGLDPEAILKSRFTERGWQPDLTYNPAKDFKPPVMDPTAPGGGEGGPPTDVQGTHHFSPKYGR